MKRRPKIGTPIIVTGGRYLGRQGVTESSTGCCGGDVAVRLLGGIVELGVGIPLDYVKTCREPVRPLAAKPLKYGDRLYSLKGSRLDVGAFVTVRRVIPDEDAYEVSDHDGLLSLTTSKVKLRLSMAPKYWAHLEGHPIRVPE